MHEKYGVVRPGLTPPESEEPPESLEELADSPDRRAADAVKEACASNDQTQEGDGR